MTDGTSPAESVADSAVRGMADALRPDWTVADIDRSDHGTEFVATLDVQTPEDPKTVVLKATTAGFVSPESARAEPRMFELLGEETSIPVPEVYGYCDEHDDYPAPFYLMERVDGENYEGRPADLPADARERVCADAGRHIAALHELGPLPAAGTIGVADGELTVLDSDEHSRYEDYREMALDGAENTLNELEDGGFFPDLADDRERFADLVPDLRDYLRETIPALPEPDPPTYHHRDYRYGNLLLDPDTGETRVVLDWAGVASTDPVYTLANTESLLFDPIAEDDDRVATLCEAFRTAYQEARDGWSLDPDRRERLDAYLLTNRLDVMACLPLVYEDATPAERDRHEAEHREFVARYL